MGYYDNPVDDPQKNGFIRVVAEGEFSAPDYSFDLFAVLLKEDGYYLSTDSGCSCPSPWESHTADDFTGPLTAEQVHEEVNSIWGQAYSPVPKAEIEDALTEVV